MDIEELRLRVIKAGQERDVEKLRGEAMSLALKLIRMIEADSQFKLSKSRTEGWT